METGRPSSTREEPQAQRFRRRYWTLVIAVVVFCSLYATTRVALLKNVRNQLGSHLSRWKSFARIGVHESAPPNALARQFTKSAADCKYRSVPKFVRVPAELRHQSVAVIQQQRRGFVEFTGCQLGYDPKAAHITRQQWQGCCRDWGNFSAVQYPRNGRGLEYRPSVYRKAGGRADRDKSCYKTGDILLIVIFNHAHYNNTDFLKLLYGAAFGGMVFYGPVPDAEHNVTGIDLERGVFQHRAIVQAMLDHTDYGGYMWIGDDLFLNYPLLIKSISSNVTHFLDRVWMMPPWIKADVFNQSTQVRGGPWMLEARVGAASIARSCVPRQYVARMQCLCPYEVCVGKMASDIGYVPRRFVPRFIEMAYAFRETFEELALPMLMEMITDNVRTDLYAFIEGSYRYLWMDATRIEGVLTTLGNVTFAHPCKFSIPSRRRWALAKLRLVQNILKCL